MNTFTHSTDTLHTDDTPSTPKITRSQSEAAVTRQRTPAKEARLAILLDRPLLQVYELYEQFDDMTSHNFASIQGDSGLSSMSFSSTCSVTEVATSTIPGTDSSSRAPLDRLRQQERGYRFSPREEWSSREHPIFRHIRLNHEQKVTKLFISFDAHTRSSCRSNTGKHRDNSLLC